jgi:hypothetical protein
VLDRKAIADRRVRIRQELQLLASTSQTSLINASRAIHGAHDATPVRISSDVSSGTRKSAQLPSQRGAEQVSGDGNVGNADVGGLLGWGWADTTEPTNSNARSSCAAWSSPLAVRPAAQPSHRRVGIHDGR